VLTCVGWQVTLCDPIWQVTLRSCEMVYHEQLYQTFTFYFNNPEYLYTSVRAASVVIGKVKVKVIV